MSYWNTIRLEKAKQICKSKGLKPGIVIGTDIVHFILQERSIKSQTKEISWEKLEDIPKKKNLSIFEYKGFFKDNEKISL